MKIRVIAITIILVFLFTGCGNSSSNSSGKKEVELQTLTDCIGREVEVPVSPEKVAALDSYSGELMVMIGEGERMVAAPNGVKSNSLLQSIYPELEDVSAPMSNAAINIETLLGLSPDLILIKDAMYHTEGERAKLDKTGIPYLVIAYTNMEDQLYAIDLISKALGGEGGKKGEQIHKYYSDTIELATALKPQVEAAGKLRIYHSISEAVRTDGIDTIGNDWTSAVGVVNVSVGEDLKLAENDYLASLEQIYKWNPDAIICNEVTTKEYLLENDKWEGLEAIREGRVYNIPVGVTRWGHRGSVETYFAILWLGTTFYPDIYSEIDLEHEVKTFYNDILELTIDDEVYEAILSGSGIRGRISGSSNGGR